ISAFMLHKDLGLVLEAAEGRGMNDPVAVAAITGAGGALMLGEITPLAVRRVGGKRRKRHGRGENRAQKMPEGSRVRYADLALCGWHGEDYISRVASPA